MQAVSDNDKYEDEGQFDQNLKLTPNQQLQHKLFGTGVTQNFRITKNFRQIPKHTKLTSKKVFKEEKIRNEMREKQWDDRFFLGRIPMDFEKDTNIYRIKKFYSNKNNSQEMNLPKAQSVNRKQQAQLLADNKEIDKNILFEPGKIKKKTSSGSQHKIKARPQTSQILTQSKESPEKNPNLDSQELQVVRKYLQSQKADNQDNSEIDINNEQVIRQELKQLQQIINQLWQQLDIPHFHRKLFTETVRQLDKISIIQCLRQEIDALQQKRSAIQQCTRAIKAREQCLKKLQENILKIDESQDQDFNLTLEHCSEIIMHLRILTLSVVESIVRWREMFTPIFQVTKNIDIQLPYLPFLYTDQNYILGLQTDTEFIKASKLCNYMCFANTSDPFFLASQSKGQEYPLFHEELQQNIISRIRAAELVILEDAVQDKAQKIIIADDQLEIDALGIAEDGSSIENIDKLLKRIDKSVKFFNIEKANKLFQFGQSINEISWLKFVRSRTQRIQGFTLINVDNSNVLQRKVIIQQLYAFNKEQLKPMFELLVNFIWQHDSCSDIIYKIQIDNDTEQNSKLQQNECYKILQPLGFKWKQVIHQNYNNLENESQLFQSDDLAKGNSNKNEDVQANNSQLQGTFKLVIVGIKRPVSEQNKQNLLEKLKQPQSHVEFKSSVLVSEQEIKTKFAVSNQFKNMNYLQIAHCMRQLMNEGIAAKLNQENEFIKSINHLLDKKLSQFVKFPEYAVVTTNQQEQINNHIQQVFNSDIIQVAQDQQSQISCSLGNFSYNFCSFQSLQINDKGKTQNYSRIFPKKDMIEISKSQETGKQIYIIQTDKDYTSIALFTLTNDDIQQVEQQGLQTFVSKVMNSCDERLNCEQQIWIPQFSQTAEYYQPTYSQNNGPFLLCAEKIQISTRYQQQIQGQLILNEIPQDSIVIQPPFVFSLIFCPPNDTQQKQNANQNENVNNNELSLPLFATVVTQNDC